MISCSDDDKEDPGQPVFDAPEFEVSVTSVERTAATFTMRSAEAADYAYVVVDDAADAVEPTVEDLFENGIVGRFADGVAEVTTLDVEGSKTYSIYVAVRRINPYVYSEVKKIALDTNLEYTDIVTLDRVGVNDFRYHLLYQEGAVAMKHVVVKKTDYEAIKNILAMFGGVSYESYLKVFGHAYTETTDVAIDRFAAYGVSEDIHVHSGTPFILMAGAFDEAGAVIPEQFQAIEFTTREAGLCPYDVEVSYEATSTKVSAHFTPEEGVTEYRVFIDKKTEFNYWLLEGEAQLRSVIIGHWDDSTNPVRHSYSGDVVVESTGLVPETDYVIGVVALDAEGHERMKCVDFRTGEPTGPRPEITITAMPGQVTAPWKSAAYNVKIANANSVRYGYFLKSQVDEVLANGTSMQAIIEANGTYATDENLAAMLSDEGLLLETSELAANTGYIFGVYAVNEEYVATSDYVIFTTDMLPLLGGETRTNMPGHYTASTADENGATVTFPVTIATGVDDATTDEYSAANRLVALGFGPAAEFPYKSPADLIASGVSAADAATQYGPHWFIEFREDGIVVPNMQENYSIGWSMGNFGTDKNSYMWGIGTRPNGNLFDNCYDFPVEVSADGNTITVKGYYNENVSSTAYPSMVTASSAWFYSSIQFRSYSDIVLTRDPAASAYLHNGKMSVPTIVRIQASGTSLIKTGRAAAASLIQSK